MTDDKRRLKVLVVDDDAASRYALCRPLLTAGYDVAQAATGKEAFELLQSQGADLVVLDIKLPDESGLDICRKIKNDPRLHQVPVLQVSAAFTRSTDRINALEGGADAFLVMPLEPAELVAQVRALARIRAAERARDQAQAALSQSEGRLQLALQIGGLFAFEWDAAADRVTRSADCGPMLGLDNTAATQDTRAGFFEKMHPEDREAFRALVQGLTPQAPSYNTRYRLLLPSGQIRTLEETGQATFDPAGQLTHLVGIAADVTQRERHERELRETEARHLAELEHKVSERTRELQEATEHLNAFCYSVAHDLKAPLRAQVGFAHLLEEQFGPALGEAGRDYVRRIADAGERQSRLLDDLLSHMSLSRSELPTGPVNLGQIIEQACADLQAEIAQKEAHIEIGPVDATVLANASSLQLAVVHLLSNALKFVPHGARPQVRVRTELFTRDLPAAASPVQSHLSIFGGSEPANGLPSSRVEPNVVRLWVEDEGIGIPAHHHTRVFGVFQRLHTNEQYPGTGIGLAIVKRAVERMGGSVGIDSEPGRGSRFWIELPAAQPVSPDRAQFDAQPAEL